MIWPFFLCFRSPSSSKDMISIITGVVSRSMVPLHGCRPPASTITTTFNNRHTGLKKIKGDNHKAPASCQLTIRIIAYIKYNHNHIMSISHHITSHALQKKLDASHFLCIFYVDWGFRIRTIITYEHEPQCWYKCCQVPIVNWILTMVGETDTRKSTCAIHVARWVCSKSHVRWHVRLARAASSHHPARCKVHTKQSTTKASTPTITIMSYSCNRSTHTNGSDTTIGFVACKTKKFYRKNTQNQDLICGQAKI